jgi:hypothetical protein
MALVHFVRKITRRCPICRVEVNEGGVRRGWRYFCSQEHAEKYARKRALDKACSNLGGGKGAC